MLEEQPAEKNYTIESASNSDTGKKRANNEDWVAGFEPTSPREVQESGSLYIVADGVGGASKGEQASQYAAKKVLFDFFQDPSLSPKLRLQRSIRKACQEIYEYSQDSNLSRMATTLVAANVRENKLTVANVGDSRCYLIRSGKVTQITQDHNFVGELIRNGSLSTEEAKHAKVRNTLLRSLGGEPDVDVDIFGEFDLFPGDIIILCSDGLTRYADDADILRICSSGTSEKISEQLVDFANERGGADNTSVYVIRISPEQMRIIDDEGQTIPEAVSWDSIRLMKQGGQKETLKTNTPSKRKHIAITLFAVITLFMIFGAFYLSNREKLGTAKPLPPPTAAPSATPSPTVPPEVTPTINVVVVTEPTVEISPSLTPTTLPTPEPLIPTLAITPVPPLEFVCVHRIQEYETLSSILSQNYNEQTTYYRLPNCEFPEACDGDRIKIEDHNDIRIGWYLIIPVDQSTCISVGEDIPNTYWMPVTP